MAVTTSAWDVEITGDLQVNGQSKTLGLMLVPPEEEGDVRTLAATLEAVSSDTPTTPQLTTREWTNQGRGVGIDYDWAPGAYTRTPGYVCPAGQTSSLVTGNGIDTQSPIVAMCEYRGDVHVMHAGTPTQVGMIFRWPAVTGPAVPITSTASGPLAPSQYFKDMLVADDGAGTQVLWATSSLGQFGNGGNGRLHKWDNTGWTSSAFSGAGSLNSVGMSANKLATVYWMGADGVGAWRLATIASDTHIAYTLPNADPLNPANWVMLKIGTSGQLIRLIAFKRHLYVLATDGIFDINDQGESQEVTSYLKTMLQPENAGGALALNGYIYLGVGRNLIRTYVESGQYDESPMEGACGPGFGTPSEAPFRGYVGPMVADQGYVVCPIYNVERATTSIFWGIDRRVVGVQSRNPLIWFGPEVTYTLYYEVTAMWVTSRMPASGGLFLMVATRSRTTNEVRLDKVSLPFAGDPLQDIASGGHHLFCTDIPPSVGDPTGIIQPYSRIESLLDPGPNDADLDLFISHAVTNRSTSSPNFTRTHVTFETRADPTVGATTGYTEVQSPAGGTIYTTPVQNMVPNPAAGNMTQGYATQWRVRFIALDGGQAGNPKIPVLRTVRSVVLQRAPVSRVVNLTVQFGDGVPGPTDDWLAPDGMPDSKLAWLINAMALGPVTLRLRDDKRYSVILRQVLPIKEEMFDGGLWNKRITATLTAQILGPAP